MIKGVCHFFSETGTEGGYWTVQDEAFIEKNVPRNYCKHCGTYFGDQPYAPNIQVAKVILEGNPPECPEGQHEFDIGDSWSYKGLHVLQDGDYLTIYSRDDPNKVEWEGTICLREYPVFTEARFGCWIHEDQLGVDLEEWSSYFFEQYPAELIPASEP